MNHHALQYFVRTPDGLHGPYPSRRKANRSRYIKSVRVSYHRYAGPCPEFSVRWMGYEPADTKVFGITLADAFAWEECLSIDRDMLQNAY